MLPGPIEILELRDGGMLRTRILDWTLDEMVIQPRDGSPEKLVKALRINVPKDDKEFFPWYWDITGLTLIAQLLPFLEAGGKINQTFTITKHGVAPRARFTLEVS